MLVLLPLRLSPRNLEYCAQCLSMFPYENVPGYQAIAWCCIVSFTYTSHTLLV